MSALQSRKIWKKWQTLLLMQNKAFSSLSTTLGRTIKKAQNTKMKLLNSTNKLHHGKKQRRAKA